MLVDLVLLSLTLKYIGQSYLIVDEIYSVPVFIYYTMNSVQTLLSSRVFSKNLKIKIYKTTILPIVLYGCETWSLTLRE